MDVAVAEDGTAYVADLRLPGIWRIQDGQAEVFVQASKRFGTPLNAIRFVWIASDGTLYAGDSATREVYKVSEDGKLTQLTARQPALEGAALTEETEFSPENFGGIGIPMAAAADSAGALYVPDLELQRVWKIPAGGGEPEEFAVIAGARGVAVDAEDNVWISSTVAPQLVRYSKGGEQTPVIDERPIEFTHQVALDEDGTAYIADGYGKAIWKVVEGQATKWVSGDPFDNPVGLSLHDGALYVMDSRAGRIFRIKLDSDEVETFFPSGDE